MTGWLWVRVIGNINMYLQFISFLHTDDTESWNPSSCKTGTYLSMSWMLMFQYATNDSVCKNMKFVLIQTSFFFPLLSFNFSSPTHKDTASFYDDLILPLWVSLTGAKVVRGKFYFSPVAIPFIFNALTGLGVCDSQMLHAYNNKSTVFSPLNPFHNVCVWFSLISFTNMV